MDSMTSNDIDTFWDIYKEEGIFEAMKHVLKFHGSLKTMEGDVPGLVAAARDKDVDLIKFLKELDDYLAQESANDTDGTDNDGGELHADSSSEADSPEDTGERESDESDDPSPDSEADD